MSKLIESILQKDFVNAGKILDEMVAPIMVRILHESKVAMAAKLFQEEKEHDEIEDHKDLMQRHTMSNNKYHVSSLYDKHKTKLADLRKKHKKPEKDKNQGELFKEQQINELSGKGSLPKIRDHYATKQKDADDKLRKHQRKHGQTSDKAKEAWYKGNVAGHMRKRAEKLMKKANIKEGEVEVGKNPNGDLMPNAKGRQLRPVNQGGPNTRIITPKAATKMNVDRQTKKPHWNEKGHLTVYNNQGKDA